MCSFQIFEENNSHWQGNYLGYVKKYQYGNEVLNYLKTGDKEILKPLINKSLRWENTVSARERYYIKNTQIAGLREKKGNYGKKLNKFEQKIRKKIKSNLLFIFFIPDYRI